MKTIFFFLILFIFSNLLYAIDYFSGTYEESLALANAEKKNVLLIFGAKWCAPCLQMERSVLKEQSITSYAKERLIAMKIDIDTPYGKTLYKKFQVKGLPYYTLIESNEKMIAELQGKQSKDDFYNFIKLTNSHSREDFLAIEIQKLQKEYASHGKESVLWDLILTLNKANRFEESLPYLKASKAKKSKFSVLLILKEMATYAGKTNDQKLMEKALKEAAEAQFDVTTMNLIQFYFAKERRDYTKADEYLTYFILNPSASFPNDAYFLSSRIETIVEYGKQDGQAAFALKYLDYFKINHAKLIKKHQKYHWSDRAYLYHRALFLSKLGQCEEAKKIAIEILPQYPLTSKHIWGEEYKEELELITNSCQ